MSSLNKYDYRFAFRVFDQNANGYISLGDARHIMVNLSERFTEEEVDKLLEESNLNFDTLVDYEKLARLIESK